MPYGMSLRIRLYVLRIRDFPYIPMTWGWDFSTINPTLGKGLDSSGVILVVTGILRAKNKPIGENLHPSGLFGVEFPYLDV